MRSNSFEKIFKVCCFSLFVIGSVWVQEERTFLLAQQVTALSGAGKEAESLFNKGDFERACQIYSLQLQKNPSPGLCYNIGNCHSKMEHIGYAILWYRRAQIQAPLDKDIEHNLMQTRSKQSGSISPLYTPIERIRNRVVALLSINGWGYLGMATFLFVLFGIGLFVTGRSKRSRKNGFYVAVISFLLCLFSNGTLQYLLVQLEREDQAVVVASQSLFRSVPDISAPTVAVINDGVEVTLLDTEEKSGFVRVLLPDKRVGWIPQEDLKQIYPWSVEENN
ncbi:MAG: SH3 domain-containing protein [Porphyromonas sp.]|nr:SH3 domain-containing protein [Porphyromonas sp.]